MCLFESSSCWSFQDFFSLNVVFCLGCIKKILKLKDSVIISREFYGLGLNKRISAGEGANYKLLGFWNNLYTSELPLKYSPCWYFLSSVVTINEDWHLQMMLNLYIAESVPRSKLSVDLEIFCGPCALMQKMAVEGAVSVLVWLSPNVTAGSGFALRRVLWRQKGSPEPFCILSTTISSWLLLR